MFGTFWTQTKMAKVLSECFGYDYSKMNSLQRSISRDIGKRIKSAGGNEYDMAIVFMMVMTSNISGDGQSEQYIQKWIDAAEGIKWQSKLDETFEIIEKVKLEKLGQ